MPVSTVRDTRAAFCNGGHFWQHLSSQGAVPDEDRDLYEGRQAAWRSSIPLLSTVLCVALKHPLAQCYTQYYTQYPEKSAIR
eukprot:3128349-Rhodomonas_salina.1